MKKNVGKTDRIIRFVIGFVLLILTWIYTLSGWLNIVLIIVGILMIVTSLVGKCCLYSWLGKNTCKCPDCDCKKPDQAPMANEKVEETPPSNMAGMM